MKPTSLLVAVVVACSSLASPSAVRAAPESKPQTTQLQPPPAIQKTLDKIWKAVLDNDRPAFIAQGDEGFRDIAPETLTAAHDLAAPRVAKGMTATYLGQMNAKGYRVDLWKFSFNDGGDDWLVTLSTKGDVVGGFYFS